MEAANIIPVCHPLFTLLVKLIYFDDGAFCYAKKEGECVLYIQICIYTHIYVCEYCTSWYSMRSESNPSFSQLTIPVSQTPLIKNSYFLH